MHLLVANRYMRVDVGYVKADLYLSVLSPCRPVQIGLRDMKPTMLTVNTGASILPAYQLTFALLCFSQDEGLFVSVWAWILPCQTNAVGFILNLMSAIMPYYLCLGFKPSRDSIQVLPDSIYFVIAVFRIILLQWSCSTIWAVKYKASVSQAHCTLSKHVLRGLPASPAHGEEEPPFLAPLLQFFSFPCIICYRWLAVRCLHLPMFTACWPIIARIRLRCTLYSIQKKNADWLLQIFSEKSALNYAVLRSVIYALFLIKVYKLCRSPFVDAFCVSFFFI